MRHLLITIFISSLGLVSAQDQMNQGYIITWKGDKTIVLGDIDREVKAESKK